MNFRAAQNKLSSPKNVGYTIAKQQTAQQIINLLLAAEKANRKSFAKIAPVFKSGSVQDTCIKVWNFCKNNFVYQAEPELSQNVQSLPYMMSKQKPIDCKNLALFCVGILRSLGIDAFFRLCSYDVADKTPTHVYCVVHNNEQEIIIDPVLDAFNKESNSVSSIDVNPLKSNTMLNYLTGEPETPAAVGSLWSKVKDQFKKDVSKVVKTTDVLVTKTADKVKEDMNKLNKKVVAPVLKIGSKYYLAPSRLAFHALLKLNVHNFARDLAKLKDINPANYQKFIDTFAFNPGDLLHSINIGKNKKGILSGTMGFDPATLTAIASAIPVCIVAVKLLGETGVISKEKASGLTNALTVVAANDPNAPKGEVIFPEGSDVAVIDPGSHGAPSKTWTVFGITQSKTAWIIEGVLISLGGAFAAKKLIK